MGKKIIVLGIIWAAVILAYIIMAFSMSAMTEIIQDTSTALVPTENTTPYVKDAVDAFPFYVWFIPGFVAIATTVVILKRD